MLDRILCQNSSGIFRYNTDYHSGKDILNFFPKSLRYMINMHLSGYKLPHPTPSYQNDNSFIPVFYTAIFALNFPPK